MTAIWAIAHNTIRMTTRRLAALVVIVTILLGSLFIFYFIEVDNTLIGLLRVVMAWSFGFMSIFLMSLMLYFSSTVLDTEIVGKQIYVLDVKPVPRWKILAGKWLGLTIVGGLLLLGMGSLTYGTLMWLAYRSPDAVATSKEHVESDEQEVFQTFRNQLFVSRQSWRPRLTNVEKHVEELARNLKKQGFVDAERADTPEFRDSLRAFLRRRVPPIDFGEARQFTFTGLPSPANERAVFFIRYKLYGRRGQAPETWLSHEWELRPESSAAPVRRSLRSRAGVTKEFRAPFTAISAAGTLELSLTNSTGAEESSPAAQLIVPARDGIELLVTTGSFEMNFTRGLFLLWIRLVMLAGIGIAANTFLRGPVTAFLLFGLILTGSLNSFVHSLVVPKETRIELRQPSADHRHEDGHHDSQRGEQPDGENGVLGTLIDTWRSKVLPVLFRVVPDFGATNPVPDLLVGREIGWTRLAAQAFYDLGLRAGSIWLLGLYCFHRKEVGLPVTD